MPRPSLIRPANPSGSLATALRLSVMWDLASLLLLLWMPLWLLDAFGHPVPAEPFLFRLAALPLLMAPVVYAMAAVDPVGRPLLVTASVRLRLLGGVGIVLLVAWQRPVAPLAYLCFAGADFAWGLLYLLLRARS